MKAFFKQPGIFKGVLIGSVAGLAMGGVAFGLSSVPSHAGTQGAPKLEGAQWVRASDTITPPGTPMSFADIIEKVSPAVVSIETVTKIERPSAEELFGLVPPGQGLKKAPKPKKETKPSKPKAEGDGGDEAEGDDDDGTGTARGAGSGFFISADGYIVTNNHVVENAKEIKVKLTDERELKAKVVGVDKLTDLAVLKVEGKNFPFVQFETKVKIRVGDWVVAVGNPFGLSGTATAGIVSAKARDTGDSYVDFLQIDAPINRGNSGGPTFDIYGRVIGVNSAIITPNGGSAGIGFAIPADLADRIVKTLIVKGKVDRGYIGVQVRSLDEDMVKSLGLKSKDGAYVADVPEGGPSSKAGIKSGDIITAIDGVKIKDNRDLTRRVGQVIAGSNIKVDVLRDGKPIVLNVNVAVRPTEDKLSENPAGIDDPADPKGAGGPNIQGMVLAPLSDAQRTKYRIDPKVQGIVIVDLDLRSEAVKRGLRPGDVIVKADNQPVAKPADLETIVAGVKKSGRPSILLLVNRQGVNVPLPLPLK